MPYFVPAYWPLFTTTEQRHFEYYSSSGQTAHFSSVFLYNSALNSMEYENFDGSGKWLNTWFYRYQPGFGIAEWQDQYPQTGPLAFLFGPVKTVAMSPPIGWGEWANIGSTFTNRPSIDPLKSRPPQLGTGLQAVTFEAFDSSLKLSNGATYSNVLVFADVQIWNGQAQETRFWMAQGIGPVAVQFFTTNSSTGLLTPGPRFDAAAPLPISAAAHPANVLSGGPGDALNGAAMGNDMFLLSDDAAIGAQFGSFFVTGDPIDSTSLQITETMVGAPGPVPGAGLAGLAALGLAGLYVRTRRA